MKVELGPYINDGERKVDIHIDPWDTWSMDYTLSLIIVPLLKQLKETKHGAPIVDVEDTPKELHPPEGEEACGPCGETDVNFFRRWDWIMDEMIWAFNEIATDKSDLFLEGQERKDYINRKQRAFKLFGKYFEALWD